MWWSRSHPQPPRRLWKSVNITLHLTSTPKETRVRPIASAISDEDVTKATITLPPLKCVVDVVVVMHHSVQHTNHDFVDVAGNTCSSYRTPDVCDGQLDTSSFTAQELCCGCGGGFQWFSNSRFMYPRHHFNVSTPIPTTTMHHAHSTIRTHRHEWEYWILVSLN